MGHWPAAGGGAQASAPARHGAEGGGSGARCETPSPVPRSSVNLRCVNLREVGGRSGARRGRITVQARHLLHVVEPLRVDSLRIRIEQSALVALLEGVETLDERRVAAPLVGGPEPFNRYIAGLYGESARGELPGEQGGFDRELVVRAKEQATQRQAERGAARGGGDGRWPHGLACVVRSGVEGDGARHR